MVLRSSVFIMGARAHSELLSLHPRVSRARRESGYTLIELVLVASLIMLILAVAMPRLMPAFAFSQLEAGARHLANYGRSAVAHCALHHESITVRFDFETQEYYALRWLPKERDFFGNDGKQRQFDDKLGEPDQDEDGDSKVTVGQLLSGGSPDQMSDLAFRMQWQIQQALQKSLEARARNVRREGILDEIGPLFDEEFRLDDDEEESREEIKTSLLERTAMPSGVVVERIWLGATEYQKGTVDIEVTPMGLYETVMIQVRGENDDYYTVTWDPITGGAHLARGKETPR